MYVYFITFRSVTLAQRGESVLRKNGIRCALQRTPRWMEEKGCGYCLRLQHNDIDSVIRLLRENAREFRKVYIQRTGDNVEEVEV